MTSGCAWNGSRGVAFEGKKVNLVRVLHGFVQTVNQVVQHAARGVRKTRLGKKGADRMAIDRRMVLAGSLLGGLLAVSGPAEVRAENDLCPVVASQDWEAWLSRTPFSGDRLMLHVRGTVSLPTPGYTVNLREGPLTRSFPPTQMVVLEVREPINRIGTQVVDDRRVSVILPGQENYKSVRVVCGKTLLHEFSDVPLLR